LLARKPKPRPGSILDGFMTADIFSLLVGGVCDSGKTCLLASLKHVLSDKEEFINPLHVGSIAHHTLKPTVLSISDNFIAIDTKGVDIGDKVKFDTQTEAKKFWKEKQYDEFGKMIEKTNFFLKQLSDQQIPNGYFPQIVLLVAPATIFESKYIKVDPSGITKIQNEYNRQLLLKTWIEDVHQHLPNSVHVVLTMKDLLREDENQVKANAAKFLDTTNISLITNFTEKNCGC